MPSFLLFWVINWMGSFVGPTAQAVLAHLSIIDHFDDFAKGIIDTKHLIYYVSFIAIRAVPHGQGRGYRTVAGLMVKTLIGAIGWVGTVLVFAAVAVRFSRPEWIQYAQWGAWAGLVCVLIYMAGQWRDVVVVLQRARRALRHACRSSASSSRSAFAVAVNYLGVRQNKRWDLTANQFYSLSDQTVKILKDLDAPVKMTVYLARNRFRSVPRSPRRVRAINRATRSRWSTWTPTASRRARAPRRSQSYGTIVIEYKDKTERVTTNDEQAITNGIIKAMTGAAAQGLLHAGPRREGHRAAAIASATPDWPAR